MKNITYLLVIILLSMVTFSFNSCHKGDDNNTNFSASAELPLAANNGVGNIVAEPLLINSTPQVIQCVVNISSSKALSTAATATFGLDNTAIIAYNNANGTNYALLPAADYTVPGWTVSIPAGQTSSYLNISIITSKVDPSQIYLLPIKLESASNDITIDKYNEVLYCIQVKNQYDGTYVVTGSLVDNTNPAIYGLYPETIELQTTGANTDAYYDSNVGFAELFNTPNGSYYGSFSPIFTFSGNTVTAVTNYYGQLSGDYERSAVISSSGVNTYTTGSPGQPGSVFQVQYIMTQGNPAVPRTTFTQTFTYKGSR